MKRICILTLAALAALAAGAAEPADSVAGGVDERGAAWDFSRLSGSWGIGDARFRLEFLSHAALGWCGAAGNAGGLDFRAGRSVAFSADLVDLHYYLADRRHYLSLGFGAGVKRFGLGRDTHLAADGAGGVEAEAFPDGATSRRARLTVYSLRVPFYYNLRVKGDWYVHASAALDFALGGRSSAAGSYRLDGHKTKETLRNLPLRPVSVDFTLGATYVWAGLYVRYSPCSVFRKGEGPGFTPFSAGLTLFF